MNAKKNKIVPILLVLLILCSSFSVLSATTASNSANTTTAAGDDLIDFVPDGKFKNQKMESVIAHIVDASESNLAEAQSIARESDIDLVDEKIRVVLELTDAKATLEDTNIEIEARYKNLVQALVPISVIEAIAKDPAVVYIRTPLKAYPLVTSEGVGVIGADEVHAKGIRGDDVKVAVIDAGFEGYATNPEIPAANIIEAKSFRADGDIEAGGDHGTACAEVVLDVAPEAGLYLFNFDTGVEFGNDVDYAISQGVDIISCSMGWANAGGYDGTGSICDIVNNAREHGILFVVSAGNQAEKHYEGTYTDTDGDDWHEFGPGDEILTLETLPAGTSITLFLSWDDWPESDQDYDLRLLVKTGTAWETVAVSENYQTGTQPPAEAIVVETAVEAYWGVGIKKYSATRDVHFELYSFTNNFPEHNVKSSSLCIPAGAAGAMTAGATYWSDDSLESFSSQGPTNDGRTKPDVTAPDGVSNSVYGNFYGTSASAPHTAGAAALLLDANATLTADQLQSYLESTAVDLGATGKDNLYGSGRIDVLAAYNECVEPIEGGFVDVLSVDASSFTKIWTHVYVNTSAGRAGELTESDFEVYEDGVVQTIESFNATGGGVTTKADILFVFDDTGSMYDEISDMKAKVKNLTDSIEAAGIDARYALVSFKDAPELDQGWTSDASTFKSAVDALYASGGWDEPEDDLDALEMGLGLGFRTDAQKIIIDITDAHTHYRGDGSGYSDYTMPEVEEDLLRAGVTFIAVSPDFGTATTTTTVTDNEGKEVYTTLTSPTDNDKKVLAEDVGGLWIDIHAADFAEILDRIIVVITTAYHIDYTTTNPAKDCTNRTVRVVVHMTLWQEKIATLESISHRVKKARVSTLAQAPTQASQERTQVQSHQTAT